ncbi:MAG: hypothetical protein IPN48_09430 [Sphingomonadales bacterium]|nr:hypothetical protein [Sphingomonadales bacterium]
MLPQDFAFAAYFGDADRIGKDIAGMETDDQGAVILQLQADRIKIGDFGASGKPLDVLEQFFKVKRPA